MRSALCVYLFLEKYIPCCPVHYSILCDYQLVQSTTSNKGNLSRFQVSMYNESTGVPPWGVLESDKMRRLQLWMVQKFFHPIEVICITCTRIKVALQTDKLRLQAKCQQRFFGKFLYLICIFQDFAQASTIKHQIELRCYVSNPKF